MPVHFQKKFFQSCQELSIWVVFFLPVIFSVIFLLNENWDNIKSVAATPNKKVEVADHIFFITDV
ncbi:MAG: hypothetical protein C4308_03330 [Chitinophagaceae bacterium]